MHLFNLSDVYRYNPIEFVFSEVKANFKKARAKKLMGVVADSHKALVMQSFTKLRKGKILKCIDHCVKLLN